MKAQLWLLTAALVLAPSMSYAQARMPHKDAGALGVDMNLEVVTLPVSDVDRAKSFYERLGWRFDIDLVVSDDVRWISANKATGEFCQHNSAWRPPRGGLS